MEKSIELANSLPPDESDANNIGPAIAVEPAIQEEGEDENEETNNLLIFRLIVLILLDTIAFFRYIFLPELIISLFGGPSYFILPMTLWALVGTFITVLFISFNSKLNQRQITDCSSNRDNTSNETIKQPNMSASSNESIVSTPTEGPISSPPIVHQSYSLVPIYTEVKNYINNQTDILKFEIKYELVIVYIVYSVIEIILCVLSFILVGFIILFTFIEPDNQVAVGWQFQYNIGCAELAFLGFSIFIRFLILITLISHIHCKAFCNKWNMYICKKLCPIPRLRCVSVTNNRINMDKFVFFNRCIIVIINSLAFAVAFGFTFYCIHGYIRSIQPTPVGTFTDCDPMVTKVCILPWPSNYWLLDENNNNNGGLHVNDHTMPYTRQRKHISSSFLSQYDGFSVSSSILFHLPNVRDYNQLTNYSSIQESVKWQNMTSYLLNLNTGELHPHFTEADFLDVSIERIMYIQPAKALDYQTRYVAIVANLVDENGALLPASSVVETYLTAYNTGLSNLGTDNRYERLVPALDILQNNNIATDTIQLIWDFDTASITSLITETLLDLPDLTVSKTNEVLTSVSNGDKSLDDYIQVVHEYTNKCDKNGDYNGTMGKVTYYRINVPWYLTSLSRNNNQFSSEIISKLKDGTLNTDDIEMKGSVGLVVQVPCSVTLGLKETNSTLEYAHGIFGNRGEAVYTEWLVVQSNYFGNILWTMDWRGWAGFDYPELIEYLAYDYSKILSIEANTVQGFHSKIAGRIYVSYLLEHEYKYPSIDASYFIGVSMGGILGSGYTRINQYDRSVLLVSANPFSFILGRSSLFKYFIYLLKCQYESVTDIRIGLTILQIVFDKAEGSAWSISYTNSTFKYYNNEGNTLLQVGLGDSTVTTIGSEILARNMNATIISPTFYVPDELTSTDATSPFYSTTGQNYFFMGKYSKDYAALPTDSTTAEDNNVHYCFCRNTNIIQQNSYFLFESIIEHPTCLFGSQYPCVLGKTATCS